MGNLKIGWGKREISTKEPVSIPGQMYMRISEGIHDKLYAVAMCVDGGEGQDAAIFCTVDIVVLRGGVMELVREKVSQLRPELPVDSIVMGATHTHAGACATNTPEKSPDGTDIYSGAKYREFLASQCADAIVEAWDTRAEGGMAYGYGYAVVGHSRRTVYMHDISARKPSATPNGHAAMYGNTNDEWFSGYEAGADHFLNAMYTFDAQNELTGIVINVPCPSQLSEHFTKLSADFWNEVRELVADQFGPNVYVLPQCAAAGDLSPRILHYRQAQARRFALKYGRPYNPAKAKAKTIDEYNKVMGERYDIAERIMDAVVDIYGWAQKDIQTDITVKHEYEVMELSRRMISDEEKVWCENNIELMKSQVPQPDQCTPEEYRVAYSRYQSTKNRNQRAIERHETQKENPTYPTRVHTIRVGDIAFATTQFELYMDFMHRVQARSPFIQTFVIQLAGNENGSYLCTERGKANKGYSASLFCNQVGPEGGQEWVEGVLKSLKRLSDQ